MNVSFTCNIFKFMNLFFYIIIKNINIYINTIYLNMKSKIKLVYSLIK
ncbi:hypothetical protein CMALT430_550003 [Carnobacterium maltaromaticum]|nr:hypothetical protein CMALT430_550003 [Carnobacterium maltaromaticum]